MAKSQSDSSRVQQDQLEKFVRECIDPLGELAKELVENALDAGSKEVIKLFV